MNKGRLVSFEGLDGAGKTTQMALLEQWLLSHHVPYVCTREPGGTPLGIELRQLLLHRPDLQITPLAEAFLFQSDRAQHFAQLILPALAEGKLVITDRCFDASIAYQGYARGVGMELVERLSMLATQRGEQTRFDVESEGVHRRVQEGFRLLARTHPDRIKVVDASRSPEEVHQEVVALVEQLLES